MKRILLSVSSILFCFFSFSQQCSSLRYQDTIFHSVTVTTSKFGTATPYGALVQPQDLFLDFYEPTGDTLSKRPLIVFQFGGGFTIGWRSEPDIPGFCNYFAKCGYAVASIDYRIGLNPLDTNSTVRAYYRGVQDERSAIRYLCARAQQFRIDTSTLILTGTSAGCFCAFANAFTTDADRPASTFGSLLEPDDLGCYDCSGNNDLGFHIPHIKAIVNQWGAIMDTLLIEAGENTPVISFHGDQDILVPYTYGYPFSLPVFPPVYGSVPVHQRLTNLGILNVLHPLVGYSHEPELLAPQLNDTIYNYSRPFLFDLLKPNTSAITGDSIVCQYSTAHYSILNTNGSKYCWTLTGNGTITANNGHSISVQWNDTGHVFVTVKELNYLMAEGEERSFETFVVPQPVAGFTFIINELNVAFTNSSILALNYHWSFGDGDSSALLNPVKDYAGGGTYSVSLMADNGYCTAVYSASLTIDSCPLAAITYQATNHNVFFYSPITNTGAYFWNFGDGDSASVASGNVFHQYTQDGTYLVVLRVMNQLGCEFTDTVTVLIGSTGMNNETEQTTLITVLSDWLQITNQPIRNMQAEVTDGTGRRIWNKNFTGNCQFSTANLSTGIYLLRVTDGRNVMSRKFVK